MTVQPLWLALDRAAKAGGWPSEGEIAKLLERVDQRALVVTPERVAFAKPGMQITLNSLARGLAADEVAKALAQAGIENAYFDTDVQGGIGRRADGRPWRVGVRHPRDASAFSAIADLKGCIATSGDYQYFWSPDYSRNHILDPRRGESPKSFSSVSVLAADGLTADALSTAAFLLDERQARALLTAFKAEALFVDKAGVVTKTEGFPVVG